ncbi:MAG: hypothetical protein AB2A00_18145 [Myxococcota bacterium]
MPTAVATRKASRELNAMAVAHQALANLTSAEQQRAILWLMDRLKLSPSDVGAAATTAPVGRAARGNGHAPVTSATAAWVAQKGPRTDAERITCLAYYLVHEHKKTAFRTRDLTQLNSAAGLSPFTNATVAVVSAVKKGLLSRGRGGDLSLARNGDRFVEALPDRARALQVADVTSRKR